jgi:hypothetical protein
MPAASGPVVKFMDGPSFTTVSDSVFVSMESNRPFQPLGSLPGLVVALLTSACVCADFVAGFCSVFGVGFGVGFCCADPAITIVQLVKRPPPLPPVTPRRFGST